MRGFGWNEDEEALKGRMWKAEAGFQTGTWQFGDEGYNAAPPGGEGWGPLARIASTER